MLGHGQGVMRGAGAIMILVALIVGLVPLMAGADGDDSPAECYLDQKLEVVEGSPEMRQATVKADEGYVIDAICIKSGDQAFGDLQHSDLITVDGDYFGFTVFGLGTGEVTVTAGDGVKDISHVDYRVVKEPEPEPISLSLEKVWTGAEFDKTNLEVALLIDGVAGPVDVEDGQSVVITENVTGLSEQCTYKSDIVSPYLVDVEDAVDGVITVKVTNDVTCVEDQVTPTTVKPTTPDEKETEVLPIVVTTTTTTVPTEVLPVEVVSSVVAQTLPYTGPSDLGWLHLAAGAVALGSLLVIGTRREESEG